MSEEKKEEEPSDCITPPPSKVDEKLVCIPRQYADANIDRHIDFDNLKIETGDTSLWRIYSRLGRGKYSEVFEGKNATTGETACVKILKPCLPKLLKLEIFTLQHLSKGPNIIRLLDTLQDDKTDLWCLVFEILNGTEFKNLLKTVDENELRHYLHEILRGLDYAHSLGVIHRDIKPQNILIDPKKKVVRLIDWGLGSFYYPREKYSVRVATRAYKAPELLVEYQQYHYAVDLWAFGCMFAGIIFRKQYFFHGSNFDEQTEKIIEVLGTDDFMAFLEKYSIPIPPHVKTLDHHKKADWNSFKTGDESKDRFVTESAIDLLDKLLRYDPNQRLTCSEAMKHPYFDNCSLNSTTEEKNGSYEHIEINLNTSKPQSKSTQSKTIKSNSTKSKSTKSQPSKVESSTPPTQANAASQAIRIASMSIAALKKSATPPKHSANPPVSNPDPMQLNSNEPNVLLSNLTSQSKNKKKPPQLSLKLDAKVDTSLIDTSTTPTSPMLSPRSAGRDGKSRKLKLADNAWIVKPS